MRRIKHITHNLIFSLPETVRIFRIFSWYSVRFFTRSQCYLFVRTSPSFWYHFRLLLMNCNESESDALCVSLLMHVLFVSRQPAPASAPACIHQLPSLLPSVHFYFSLSLLSSWSYLDTWFSSWNQMLSFLYRYPLLATIIVIAVSIFILSRQ